METNEHVRRFQQAMTDAGIFNGGGPVDGKFGHKTERKAFALLAFFQNVRGTIRGSEKQDED